MELLAEQGKSKLWLHQRSGVARDTINALAKQPRPPQAATVAAIADVLGMDRQEAARLAGLPVNTLTAVTVDLSHITDEALLAEMHRRLKR
jgi:hypothetical protein